MVLKNSNICFILEDTAAHVSVYDREAEERKELGGVDMKKQMACMTDENEVDTAPEALSLQYRRKIADMLGHIQSEAVLLRCYKFIEYLYLHHD